MAKLGEVCEVLDSKRVPITAANRVSGQYPYYGANGVQDYVADYIFDDELVLLAEDGGNFGSKEKPIAYRVSGKCWVNNHAHVLKPKAVIDVDYLCYSLMFYDVSGLVNGATRQKLTQSDMRKMEIPLRTMVEQKNIVCRLNKLTELISLRKQQLAKLDELVKARFVEMFGNPIENTMNWPKKLLRDITTKIGSGATPKGGRESYPNAGVSLIRSMNVYDGQFLYKDLAHLTDEQATQLNGVTVEAEDVLVNITGASVARSCVVPKDVLPARVNQHVAIVRCNRELLNPIFTNKMFINNEFKKALLSIGESGGATRQAITKKQLEELSVVVPPLSIQNEFFTFSECVDQQKQTVQQSLDKLELMKKALMQEYFG